MKLLRLDLYNFMSHKNTTIDLSSLSLCSIVGENGSGKSSIIEAILWNMFGYARLPNKDLIHSGKDAMYVDLDFELQGAYYKISRAYDGTIKLIITKNGSPMAQGTASNTTVLSQMIGISREVLLQSLAIQQGELSSFIRATPSERRDLIIEVLGLNRYIDAWERAKESVKTSYIDLQTRHGTIVSLQAELDKLPSMSEIDVQLATSSDLVRTINDQLQELIVRREGILARESESRKRLFEYSGQSEQLRKKLQKISSDFDDDIKRCESNILEVDRQASSLDNLNKSIENFERELEDVQQKVERIKVLKAQIELYDESIAQQSKKLDLLGKSTDRCPLCETHLEHDRWQNIVQGMKVELSTWMNRLNEATQEVKSISSIANPKDLRDRISATKEGVTRIQSLREARPSLLEQCDALKQKKESALHEIQHQIDDVTRDMISIQKSLSSDLDQLDKQMDDLKERQGKSTADAMRLSVAKNSREALGQSIQDAKERLEVVRQEIPNIEFVSNALSPNGIPLMITDHYLPLIELKTQQILSLLSDGKIDVKLMVVEGAKKGIDIRAGSNQMRPIKALSGGEQTRVSLALRIALSQVLSEISGCKFDCLVIDEPEYLDPEGVSQLVRAIGNLRGQYSQIFVMSHLPAIKSAFSQFIDIQKSGDISVATVQV